MNGEHDGNDQMWSVSDYQLRDGFGRINRLIWLTQRFKASPDDDLLINVNCYATCAYILWLKLPH